MPFRRTRSSTWIARSPRCPKRAGAQEAWIRIVELHGLGSKQLASQTGLDKKVIGKDIDRYRLDVVLDKIRRRQTEITEESLETCIEEINADMDTHYTAEPAKWVFQEKTICLYLYLVSTLSTQPHEKTLGIEITTYWNYID